MHKQEAQAKNVTFKEFPFLSSLPLSRNTHIISLSFL